MDASLQETGVPAPAALHLRAFFAQVADFMQNRPPG